MIIQTYISVFVFLTSWISLLFKSFSFTFTGIIAGAIWVPASLCFIVSIKYLGLSISQNLSTSFILIIGFLWSSVVFSEPVKSVWITIIGFILIVIGIIGISTSRKEKKIVKVEETIPLSEEIEVIIDKSSPVEKIEEKDPQTTIYDPNHVDSSSENKFDQNGVIEIEENINPKEEIVINDRKSQELFREHLKDLGNHHQQISQDIGALDLKKEPNNNENLPKSKIQKVINFIFFVKDRIIGIILVCIVGIFGGSLYIPLRYNPEVNN